MSDRNGPPIHDTAGADASALRHFRDALTLLMRCHPSTWTMHAARQAALAGATPSHLLQAGQDLLATASAHPDPEASRASLHLRLAGCLREFLVDGGPDWPRRLMQVIAEAAHQDGHALDRLADEAIQRAAIAHCHRHFANPWTAP